MPNISVLRTNIEDIRFGAMVCPMNFYFDANLNGCNLYDVIRKRGGNYLFEIVERRAAEYYLNNGTRMEDELGFVKPGHTIALSTELNLPPYILFSAIFTIAGRKVIMKPNNLEVSARNAIQMADYLEVPRINFPIVQDSSKKNSIAEYIEHTVKGILSFNGEAKKVKEVSLCIREADEDMFGILNDVVRALQMD